MSIALACNFYNDVAAMRGLLECGARYFDNLFFLNTGPGGAHSNDGSIELAKSFGATVKFDDINRGFGAIRTRLLHDCGCEWAMIMDCDERFYPQIQAMSCEGTDRYPNPSEPKLKVTKKADLIDQGGHIKNQIKNTDLMAMRATRRHWFDFSMNKPAENWETIFDHQLRIVRNHPKIHYTQTMHERLIDDRTGKTPFFLQQDPVGGPFFDHFHLFFRRVQPGHKEKNEENYARLSRGEKMI